MIVLAILSTCLGVFIACLLVALGVMLIRQTFEEQGWIERERKTQVGRGDVAVWKERRRQNSSRHDILWSAERDEAHASLQNIFRAENQRKERLEANQNALLEVEEDWMREMIQRDILALAPHAEHISEVWDAQSHLERIEESEIALAAQLDRYSSFQNFKKAWTLRSGEEMQVN